MTLTMLSPSTTRNGRGLEMSLKSWSTASSKHYQDVLFIPRKITPATIRSACLDLPR